MHICTFKQEMVLFFPYKWSLYEPQYSYYIWEVCFGFSREFNIRKIWHKRHADLNNFHCIVHFLGVSLNRIVLPCFVLPLFNTKALMAKQNSVESYIMKMTSWETGGLTQCDFNSAKAIVSSVCCLFYYLSFICHLSAHNHSMVDDVYYH